MITIDPSIAATIIGGTIAALFGTFGVIFKMIWLQKDKIAAQKVCVGNIEAALKDRIHNMETKVESLQQMDQITAQRSQANADRISELFNRRDADRNDKMHNLNNLFSRIFDIEQRVTAHGYALQNIEEFFDGHRGFRADRRKHRITSAHVTNGIKDKE